MMMMVWWDDDGKQGEGFGRPRAKDLAGLHPERHGEANWHFLRRFDRGASQGVLLVPGFGAAQGQEVSVGFGESSVAAGWHCACQTQTTSKQPTPPCLTSFFD